MMTLTQAERLVRRIGELLGQPALEGQAAKLAQEYAELARAATRRLEQCAVMIEASEDLQALQLAETPPPLLDLITVLSFRQASEWRAYCQAHRLPFVEPFYDKFVRALNTTYGKGIASDHPFYRDYRRAVMKGDDEKALPILRVIARLNPADQNTAQELKRLEDKSVRAKMDDLGRALDTGDPGAALAQLSQVEASALPIPPNHPVLQRAQIVRCQELLRQAAALREQDAWEQTEALVEEIRNVADQHAVPLGAEDVASWESLEAWTSAQRQTYAEEQDFQRALAALNHQVDTVEVRRRGGISLGLAELQAESLALSKRWREAERFQRPLEEQLISRCQGNHDWLERQIRGRTKQKRFASVAGSVIALAAIAAVAIYFWDLGQEKQFVVKLQSLETTRHVSETRDLLQQIPSRLKSRPRLAPAIERANQFLAAEAGREEVFRQKLGTLQALASQNFSNALEQVPARRAESARALAELAPEFQAGAKSNLALIDARFQSQVGVLQPGRNADFAARLAETEKAMAQRLNATNGFEAVRAALPAVQTQAAELEQLQNQPVPLDGPLVGRFRQLTNQVSAWSQAIGIWAQLLSTQPRSLEEHWERLNQMAHSPFASPTEAGMVTTLARLNVNQMSLIGGLLFPGQRAVWPLLTNLSAANATFRPAEPSEAEKAAYVALRDDRNIEEVYWYDLTKHPRPDNRLESHPVLTQGQLADNKLGKKTGVIYDPKKSPEALRFEQQTVSDYDYNKVEKRGLAKESGALRHLGILDLLDTNTGGYQKSILGLLDRISADKESSSLFRAYVTLKLCEIAELRPLEWGLHWAPSVALHLQNLRDAGAQNIQSGDWMVPNQVSAYETRLQKCFDQAGAVSFEKQARFFQRAVRRVVENDFEFAGYIDAEGKPVLTRTNAMRGEYWGWSSRSGSAALLLRRTEGSQAWQTVAEPLGFTPLFTFRGDREAILEETAKTASYAWRAAAAALPPLFAGLGGHD